MAKRIFIWTVACFLPVISPFIRRATIELYIYPAHLKASSIEFLVWLAAFSIPSFIFMYFISNRGEKGSNVLIFLVIVMLIAGFYLFLVPLVSVVILFVLFAGNGGSPM